MAKRGRKPKAIREENYDQDGPVKENFLEMEEELLQHVDTSEIEDIFNRIAGCIHIVKETRIVSPSGTGKINKHSSALIRPKSSHEGLGSFF